MKKLDIGIKEHAIYAIGLGGCGMQVAALLMKYGFDLTTITAIGLGMVGFAAAFFVKTKKENV